MATKTDAQVQKLFEIVQTKKAEIAKAEKPNWKTNCSFRWDINNTSSSFNIQTVSDPRILIMAAANLTILAGAANEMAIEFGVDKFEFEWLGFSLEDWKSDFKTRITKIQISKKKSELASLETRLNSLISPELKAELELAAIAKELDL